MGSRTFLGIFIILTFAAAWPGNVAFGDYTATGRFMYQDLEIDLSGFTGVRPNLPIRLADVLIMDAGTNTVIAQDATDLNGEFSLMVSDGDVRDISIIVVANSENTAGLNQAVMLLTQFNFNNRSNGTTPHAFEGMQVSNHDPGTDLEMGTVVAFYRQGGEPFNIYDTMLANADFLDTIGAGRPGASIKTIVNYNIDFDGDFGFYRFSAGPGGGIFLGQNSGYDDTIILHELGHYVEQNYGPFDNNPGGSHFIGDSAQDPLLSWGEGWPTFWGSNVRLWRGDLHPNTYVNSVGDSTPGVISFSYDLESNTTSSGASAENSVQAALWDMTDGPSTPDFSPGEDDEPGYEMTRQFLDTWLVTAIFMAGITEPRSFEDFYEAWNFVIPDPQTEALDELIFTNHRIEFRPDAFEDNNDQANATELSMRQLAGTHHNHFPEGDEDWLVFNALSSVEYSFSTNTMRDGADTYLSVHDAAGMELASNDDVAAPQSGANNAFEVLRSQVEYQPAENGPLFIRIRRSPNNLRAKYGNYNFAIRAVRVEPEAPNLSLTPSAIVLSLPTDQTASRTVIVTNTGTRDTLTYQVEEQLRDMTPANLPWLATDVIGGRLGPSKSDSITLAFDAGQGEIGQNVARLEFRSNDPDNSVRPLAVVLTVTPSTVVEGKEGQLDLPTSFALHQSYPNPFVISGAVLPATRISFQVPATEHGVVVVKLRIFDVLGREIRVLTDEVKQPGIYEASWDGRDRTGVKVGSGVYFYEMVAGEFQMVKKLIVAR